MADQQQFEIFAHYLKEACGIALTPNKEYLVATRIRRILQDHQLNALSDLVKKLQMPGASRLRQEVIDAMTTNETFWFRDAYPFEYLKQTLLPEMMKSGSGDLRIWSAACSSGQEPYSISMVVDEYSQSNFGGLRRPVRIVGSDVSSNMLNLARDGVYDRLSMARGMTHERMEKFFEPLHENAWRVKSAVKSRVEFKCLNLLDSFAMFGKFDMIFCRNVLIYFSGDLKREIITKLHGALKPGGYLCLGSSEGLSGVPNLFEMIHCSPGIMYRAIH